MANSAWHPELCLNAVVSVHGISDKLKTRTSATVPWEVHIELVNCISQAGYTLNRLHGEFDLY